MLAFRFVFVAFLTSTFLGVCPMQLSMATMDHAGMEMDHSTMSHGDTEPEDTLPCSDCFASLEHFALREATALTLHLPLSLQDATVNPQIELHVSHCNSKNDEDYLARAGPVPDGPSLTGTIVLRT